VIKRSLKSLVKRVASPLLDGLGVYERDLKKLPASSWTIAMYHRIINDPTEDPFSLGMCVTSENFNQQLAYFRSSYTPIAAAEAVRRLKNGEPLPDRALSITFDDGYLDNYTVALPSLQSHGLSAALYVPTGGLDDDEPLWWDRVIHAFDATDATALVPSDFGIPLPDKKISLSRWQKSESVACVLDALWTLPYERMLDVVASIERQLPRVRSVAALPHRMTSQQVLAMHRAGIEIGAHTVKHSNLSLETPAVVRHEMQASRRVLEDLCDAPIEGFAYPAGWKTADTETAAREIGFSYAISVVSGINRPSDDLFTLQRVGMPDAPVSDFKRALASVTRRTVVHAEK
jgi:peptidoglycan/xylan/chitin deacetylase (PgdA/CDA1 family)